MRRTSCLIVSFAVILSHATLLAQDCDSDKRAAQNQGNTVSERYEYAKKYRACVMTHLAEMVQQKSGTASPAVQELVAKEADRESAAVVLTAKKEDEFKGLKWGLGFGYSVAFGDAITEAAVVNGVIRATKDESQQARAVLEGHNYVGCDAKNTSGEHGCGPYVAVIADSDDVLAGVSLGFMFGWKSTKPDTSQGFSIGVGVLLENNVKDLADGFNEGQPLPPGETEIRFLEKGRWSALVFATRTF